MDAAIRKAKDSIGQIFDKNLHDLVRGIRNHKENESKYIAECIDEIKVELKQDNLAVKANAINKLCYLQMLGYDISWAAFNIIEVMSSTKFTHKRIGYLAASQSFHEGTDVLMLTTNMIRKDLSSQSMFEAGVALSGLSCFITPEIALNLSNDILTLMTSSKPYIRKKAVLLMYKIFLKYPDALRPSFPRLKEKLDDPDPSVQAAAVNVICELARKNPKNYLSLAPIFFKLMTSSSNNWVLIKIIKLFAALTPLEPRLGNKLIEPLTNLINSTSAMSLLYECINTVLAVLVTISSGQPNHDSAIQICLQKLRILIEDSDQNLKYLGLLAMSKILQTNPKSVLIHKDLIMQCLDDKDESIRLRALDLLYGMVTKKTLMEIIRKLMNHMNKAEGSHYRDELLAKIVDICSQNNYQYVTNFEWYVSVLVELTRMEGTRHGKLLASQMLDVAIRVESIRPFIVAQMSILLDNIHVFSSNIDKNSTNICEVLYAATWICGEFAEHLNEPFKTMESMLKSKVTNLPGHIQSSFVQNVFKLYSLLLTRIYQSYPECVLTNDGFDECKNLTQYVMDKIHIFELNADIEVQERACTMVQILKYVLKLIEKQEQILVTDDENQKQQTRIDIEIANLFEGDLNPVAPKAQKKVPVPEGLNLDDWINTEPSDLEDNEEVPANENNKNFMSYSNSATFNQSKLQQNQHFNSMSSSNYGGNNSNNNSSYSVSNLGAKKVIPDLSEEELAKMRESRKIQVESNPFYIKPVNVKKSESNNLINTSSNDQFQSQSIDLKTPLSIPVVASSDSYYRMSQIDNENKKLKKKMKKKLESKKSKKDKKSKHHVDEDEDDDNDDEDAPVIKVLQNEMPEGAIDNSDDDEKNKRDKNDPHRALDINLDEVINDYERTIIPANKRSVAKTTEPAKATNGLNKIQDDKATSSSKTKKKSSKKESSKKKKSSKTNDVSNDLLIQTDLPVGNGYSELLSPDNETNSLNGDDESSKATSQPKVCQLFCLFNILKLCVYIFLFLLLKAQDDIDFWLSNEQPIHAEPLNNGNNLNVTTEESTKSEKKSKKEKGEGEKEKEKEKKTKNSKHKTNGTTTIGNGVKLKKDKFKSLASNNHLKLSYLAHPNSMNLNQIIVNIKLKNLESDSKITSIELNVLDSSTIKLVRNDPNEPLRLPFSLESGDDENQIELLFNVNDCTYAQKLKGTLTYIIKVSIQASERNQDHKVMTFFYFKSEKDSFQEKIDFKMNISCSTFLIQRPSDKYYKCFYF
jgi:AP-3 complex subunit delta-1